MLLHASSRSNEQAAVGDPYGNTAPAESRPNDFALPHGRPGEVYRKAPLPGSIFHDHNGI